MNTEASHKTEALINPAWVAAHRDDPNVCVIDVAGLGQDDLQAYKAGHVPGARPWKWKETLWDTHMRVLRDDVLRALGQSRTLTVLYFVLTELLGLDNVRVYDGSWTEWGNLVGVPVER